MSEKEMEAGMLRRIDELGLVRVIQHNRVEVSITPGMIRSTLLHNPATNRDTPIRGFTQAYLVRKDCYCEWKNMNKRDSYPVAFRSLTEAEGVAYCSAKDNFSKRRGRLIATARALKAYDNEHGG